MRINLINLTDCTLTVSALQRGEGRRGEEEGGVKREERLWGRGQKRRRKREGGGGDGSESERERGRWREHVGEGRVVVATTQDVG